MTRNQYQDYLDSLPRAWARERLRSLGSVVGGGTPSRAVPGFWGGEIPWITPGELEDGGSKRVDHTRDSITAAGLAASGAVLVPVDTLLVTTRATLGRRALSDRPMTTNQGFKSVVFDNRSSPDFYFHLADRLKGEITRRASGTTFLEISSSQFADIEVPVPPLEEQHRIAQILDTLDDTIAASERLVVKLDAIRAGLARSLFDDLGATPRLPLAALCAYFDDGDWIETPFIADRGIRLIQTGNIGRGEYLDKPANARYVSEATYRLLHCKPVRAGDLLFCRLADPVARACQIPGFVGPAITSVDCSIVRVDPSVVDPRFVLHWASEHQWLDAAEQLAAGSTRKRISRSNLGRLAVPTPPVRTQQEVARTIDAALARVERVRSEASKLRSIRVALTHDLLTGRVRAEQV